MENVNLIRRMVPIKFATTPSTSKRLYSFAEHYSLSLAMFNRGTKPRSLKDSWRRIPHITVTIHRLFPAIYRTLRTESSTSPPA